MNGHKRNTLVEMLGNLPKIVLQTSEISEWDGARLPDRLWQRLKKGAADGGFDGKGVVLLPRCWIVERALASWAATAVFARLSRSSRRAALE